MRKKKDKNTSIDPIRPVLLQKILKGTNQADIDVQSIFPFDHPLPFLVNETGKSKSQY